jgi:integrase
MTVEGFVEAKYVYCRNNIYYFCRWIPSDIKPYYTKQKITHTLKTRSLKRALMMARSINAKIEDYWLGIRLKNYEVPISASIENEQKHDTPTIVDCLEHYLSIKGKDKSKAFENSSRRAVKYFVLHAKNKPISAYLGSEAVSFRDSLATKGLSSASIRRILATLKAITNFTISELGLDTKNPFTGLYIPKSQEETKRPSISPKLVHKVQQECLSIDDDLRWIAALISDTGMRLAEVVGLKTADINLENDIPYINLTPHSSRPLKTVSSKRIIPLVGASLWAAKQALKAHTNEYVFPRYTNSNKCNSNSASAAINKWLKKLIGKDYVIHGFRHSFRDRLRNNNTPTEMIDQLGGWSMQTVGQSYGQGFNLENLHKQMQLLE